MIRRRARGSSPVNGIRSTCRSLRMLSIIKYSCKSALRRGLRNVPLASVALKRRSFSPNCLRHLPSEFLDHVAHRFDNVFNVAVAHTQVERQRDDALELVESDGELFGLEAVLVAVVRMRVYGDEVNARADAAL